MQSNMAIDKKTLPLFDQTISTNICENYSKVKTVLDRIHEVAEIPIDEQSSYEDEQFVMTLKKNTTTPSVRMQRCKYILKQFIEAFEE